MDFNAIFEAWIEQTEDFVLLLDGRLDVARASRSWTALIGERGFVGSQIAGSRARAVRSLRHPGSRTMDLVHLDATGRARRIAWRGADLRTEAGSWHLLIGRDLVEQDHRLDQILRLQHVYRRANEEMTRLAHTDALTGLANRRAAWEQAERAWSAGGVASVIILDLDHFKAVNDHYGHEAGDAVLEAVGACLKRVVRPPHTPARWGGEEFICFCHGEVPGLAQNVWAAVRDVRLEEGADAITISASVGVAHVPDVSTVSLSDAIAAADAALYQAKAEGRDRVVTREVVPRSASGTVAIEERRARRWVVSPAKGKKK
jgi:diguanylate cyclase (GGDEF)-like protein